MANSKLLKEAIADAKAVKETALANAKLALEEAFTPRLQSILTQKLQAEAEMENDEDEMQTEELSSTGIGSKVDAGYAETPGSQPTLDANTDLSVGVKKDAGKPEQAGTDYKKVAEISEEENPFDDAAGNDKDAEIAELKARIAELEGNDSEEETPMDDMQGGDDMDVDNMEMDNDTMDSEMGDDSMDMSSDDEESEEDMDLEAIIRELEQQLEGNDSEEKEESMYEAEETEEVDEAKDTEEKDATNEEAKEDDKSEMDEVIDLEEILREMEADMKGDDKESVDEAEEEKEKELEEAYSTIKSLQKTINEVNLLNAKLLFANKLFRAHNMTNEQKVKVIETLDRTNSVREVKLVYSTLAENFKYTPSNKIAKNSIAEGIASKVTKSTKPAQAEQKQVIAESADFSDRFKKLAGIIK